MFHPISRHGLPADGKLSVPHPTYESARALYPHDRVTAVRAYVKSEAARLANKVVFPCEPDPALCELVSDLIDVEWVRAASLRSRRFDLMAMLIRDGRVRWRVTNRLLRQGKIDDATARAVLA